MKNMFHEIDENIWDRKEIYDAFYGYTYAMTVQLDMTELYAQMKEHGYKFYPTICWLITKTVNSDVDYRFGKVHGIIGYYDQMNTSYTLRRSAKPHLFTHMVTEYNEDFETYYEQFLKDKQKAEAADRLYYYEDARPDSVDVSTTPDTSFTAISYSIPDTFYQRGGDNMRYTPFTTVGRFYQKDGRVMLPITGSFHHAVNDGYHAEKFFRLLQENIKKGVTQTHDR